MTGAFRRAILLRAADGRVDAELEDDFHQFGISVRHDGRVALGIEARAGRFPWVTCSEATTALASLEGAPVTANPAALFLHADPRAHCTHLFELAALALAQAARGEGTRRFEAEVSDPIGESRSIRLFRDQDLVVDWRLAGDVVTEPDIDHGVRLADLGSRRLAELEPERAEALMILRRVAQTARGRQMDVDAYATAAAMERPAQCYSLQPGNAARAVRVKGSIRDWPSRADLLSATLRHAG